MYADRAESYLGKSRSELGMQCQEWCAEFVSKVIAQETPAQKSITSISCSTMIDNMQKSDDWYEPEDEPQRDDIIFFDWNRVEEGKNFDHVGVITGYSGKYVTYVNGNGDSAQYVTRQSIHIDKLHLNEKYPCKYMRRKPAAAPAVSSENIVMIAGRKYKITFEEVIA